MLSDPETRRGLQLVPADNRGDKEGAA